METHKYNEDDVVSVTFERGETLMVKLGRPRKMINENGTFLGWSYDSKTNSVNWVAECWIN